MKPGQEKPLHLDIDFADALRRFARTQPEELAESVATTKKSRDEAKKDQAKARLKSGERLAGE